MRRHFRLITRPAAGLLATALGLAALAWAGLSAYGGSSGYVVQPGDSLWAIATAHRITVAQLASSNGLDPAAILPIGRHLQIPSSSAHPASSGSAGSSAGSSRSSGSSGSSSGVGPTTVGAQAFCSLFVPTPGPWGVLPSKLSATPSRMAVRAVIDRWAGYYGVSAPLLEAITWQESGWQQGVVSATGAVGVGQIEPYTAEFIQEVLIGQPLDIHSLSDNIRMAAAFVGYLAHIEGNNRCATIAAYYEGPLNLGTHGVYVDTQRYVADVEALIPRFS